MAIFAEIIKNKCMERDVPPFSGDTLTNTGGTPRKRMYVMYGCKLLLLTNMKSHTGFRLVSKSVTLNDLQRRNDS